MSSPEGASPVVTDLYIYPIKACAGIRVLGAAVGKAGFADDRRWMIVDDEGKFVTQRTLPQLSQVKVSIVDFDYRISVGDSSFSIPRRPTSGRPRTVQIWKDQVTAWEHDELGEYLSDTLGGRYHGVFVPDDALRAVNPARARAEDRVGFADGYPFLMVSRESLDELNRRLAERDEPPLDMRRFRPNIVVGGCAYPHQEDDHRTLRIGQLDFRMPKACDRCVVTTVNPDTAERGREPLRTLASYRRWDNAVWFGVNLIHDGEGSLRMGAQVTFGERVVR